MEPPEIYMMESLRENLSLPSFLDFIADPGLIETYANKTHQGPSIPQLIDLILRQASLENNNEPFLRVNRVSRVDVDERTFLTTRRNRAAKTVTLMLASALKWDLTTIEKDLSITMQFCLVQDMLNTVFGGTEYCSSIAEPVNTAQRSLTAFTGDVLRYLPDHCVFGLALYARWILRAHIQRKIPKKPAKGGIVSIGAITDPVVLRGLDQQTQGNSLIWSLFRQISRDKVSQTAVDLLGAVIKLDRDAFRVPISASFVIPSSATKTVEPHNWSIGETISFIEMKIQIIFDLAGYWMFEGKLTQTAEYLQMLLILLKQRSLSSLQFVQIDASFLHNMCKIAGVTIDSSVTGVIPSSSVELMPSLKSKLLEILLEDLNTGSISASARTCLEFDILMSEDNAERAVLQKVRLCNLFREYLAGTAMPSFAQLRNVLSDATPGDVEWMKTTLNSGRIDDDLRAGIMENLGYLVEHDLLPAAVRPKICDFLSDSPRSPSMSPVKDLLDDVEMSSLEPENVAELYRIIASTTVYSLLKSAVFRLVNHSGNSKGPSLKDFNPTWPEKVPPTLKASCAPNWSPVLAELTCILFAKSTDLVEQGCFRAARHLLKQLRSDLPSVPAKFDRNFRWQNTFADLAESMQMINSVGMTNDLRFEALKRAKNCMSAALMKPPDEEPVPMYVQSIAVMVLFNLEEWEYITEAIGLQDQKRKPSSVRSISAIFPFLKQLILACNEYQPQLDDLVTQSKGGRTKQTTVHRQHCMKLWNNLSATFSILDPSLSKKPSSASSPVPPLPADVLLPYIKMIRHKTAGYLLFSCIFRMWNVSNRDSGNYTMITELLWPTTIPLHLKIQPEELLSGLEAVFDITEKSGVCDPEIMIIKGDYHYNKGQYGLAVKMYLLGAVEGSVPGFLHPAKVPTFSQNTLKKMATCFDSMRCFTYLAIISQLMDPIDYDTAFRAIGEKVTYDGADEAYRFIWDPLILEQLAFLLQKWGFLEKRQIVMDLLQNPAMTAANPPSVTEALMVRTATEFFEILFDQYVIG